MGGLSYNDTFKIAPNPAGVAAGFSPGVYRALVNTGGYVIAVRLWSDPSKAPDLATKTSEFTLRLSFFTVDSLNALAEASQLAPFQVSRPKVDASFASSPKERAALQARKAAIAPLLDAEQIAIGLLGNGGSLSAFLYELAKNSGVPMRHVIKMWRLLCRYGFDEQSLLQEMRTDQRVKSREARTVSKASSNALARADRRYT